MSEKYALFIGNVTYQDPSLGKLNAPVQDVRELCDILTNEDIGGFKRVNILIDSTYSHLQEQIVNFFDRPTAEDTVLLYFSGHGLLDENGQLFLATAETKSDKPRALSIAASQITTEMNSCRAKNQILILDCCHSGAFLNTKGPQNDQPIGAAEIFGGQGRIVLTASDTVQSAFENRNARSIFTHALVEGLRTGQADQDGDNWVSVDEWYDFAYRRVCEENPKQTPMRSATTTGKMFIAKVPPANSNLLNGRRVATSLDELDKVLRDIEICTYKKGEKGTEYENLVDFSIFKPFPYQEQMALAWIKEEHNAAHIQNAIAYMNHILISGRKVNAKKDTEDNFWRHHLEDRDDADFKVFIRDVMDEFGDDRSRMETFLRVAAFYHDIGKYINRERHPTIGWYIVQNLEPGERRALETVLDGDNDEDEKLSLFRLLMVILRDHDQFGVLSTGEASYPILLNSITHSDDVNDKIKIITALMLLNLADIAATVPILSGEIINKLKQDYEWFTENLRTYARIKTEATSRRKDGSSGPSTNVGIESFDDFVIRVSSQEDRVCKRIHRLLTTTVEDLVNLDLSQYKQDDWIKDVKEACPYLAEELKGLSDIRLVRDAYHTVFSSDTSRREFASVFTHICKLDYGKRFLHRLIGYWIIEARNQKEEAQKQKEEAEKQKKEAKVKEPQPIDAVYRLFAVLRRITGTYEAMVRSSGNLSGSLIGVEMKDLAPKDAPEKPWTIAKLIAENHYPGLTWMMSDTPAWYF